jgi:type I restriction enzyme R subunit
LAQPFTESTVEEAALELFSALGYTIVHGPLIAPGELLAERSDYSEVLLLDRLREALARINPRIPAEAIADAVRKLSSLAGPHLVESNRQFHQFLTDGSNVEYREKGRVVHDLVKLFDLEKPENNDWAAVNQFTIVENRANRRPDIVILLNGIPLALFELKNLADENATIRDAFRQFQTYKRDIPSLFPYNEILVISDGIEARLKTIARELVDTVHKNTSIDWTVKESVKAKLRSMVKRILRKYDYPPDKQEKATATVLEQAELLCKDIAA